MTAGDDAQRLLHGRVRLRRLRGGEVFARPTDAER